MAGRGRSHPSPVKMVQATPALDGPCLLIWGPQKGTAKLFEIAHLSNGVEVY